MRGDGSAAGKRLLNRIGLRHPIFQAPMGGGPTTPPLVAAVSNAGALGFIAAGYLTPDELRDQVDQVRVLTDRPIGVNAFAGGATEGAADTGPMLELVRRWGATLGAPEPDVSSPTPVPLAELAGIVLESGLPIFSVTFGVPDANVVRELKSRNVLVLGTATTVAEAVMLEEAGVDGIVAQGAEAGAHRSTFLGSFDAAMVGTMALVPQVVDAVAVPVIASGGIMDGRGIVAAQALGAAAVQMGTAFLVTDEAGVSPAYRGRLLAASEDATLITRAFSGRPARGIRNRFIADVEESGIMIPPYPLQNNLTRPLRRAAAAAGNTEAMSLWAGQGVGLARQLPAGQLVAQLVREMQEVIREMMPSL